MLDANIKIFINIKIKKNMTNIMLATAKYIAKFIWSSFDKLKNKIKIMKTLMNKKVFFF